MTKSQTFIENNIRRLANGYDFLNVDTSLMSVEKYDTASVRMMLCFPGKASDKYVSATFAAINDYVITHCPDVFLDVAYLPEEKDYRLYDDNQLPYAIGQITHLDASHFDIVGVSVAILHEILATPVLVKSFERCDRPIPTFWSDRKDLKVGSCPVIYAGGMSVFCGDAMFGEVPGKGTSFIDFAYLGNCDRTDVLIERYKEARDRNLTIQEYIDTLFGELDMVYQPQAYKVTFDDNLLITSNVKVNPKAQDFVKPYYPHSMPDDLGIGRAVLPASGANVGQTQTMISEGCSAAGACSFCSEGNYTGGWVEKDRDKVLHDCWEAKKYSAGYKYKPYSFNTNYYTDYKGLLGELNKIYPSALFNNMRMEELGRDPDAMHIMKHLGMNRMTAPIEGLSPRIQNNFLNKCLSEESLNNFMEEMVHMKVIEVKVGSILTGYEESEDYKYFYDLMMRMREKASKENGKFPIRMKATPLVHYPLTPMEYLERKTARTSYNGDKWLMPEWYDKFQEDNINFTTNGFKNSTFVEQTLLDAGRALTPVIYKHFVEPMVPLYSLRACCTEPFVNALRDMVKDPDVFFGDRDIERYISPCHRIHIDLMGSYIPRARRLLRHKHEGNVFANEPDIRCLKTYDGAKTKCYHTCIVNDPIKVFGDVRKTSDGLLEGQVLESMTGCQRCKSPEQRKQRLLRPTPQSLNLDGIKSQPGIPNLLKTRFVLNRAKAYDLLNPQNTAHTFVCKLLQCSDRLLHAYNQVNYHSGYWQSEYGFKYSFSGTQIVDVLWREDVLEEIRRVLPLVNDSLRSVKVVSVSEVLLDEKILSSDFNLYWFESDISSIHFDTASLRYRGEMFAIAGRMDHLAPITDELLMKPRYVKKGGKVCGVFMLPVKYNPDLFLSAFLSTAKKVDSDKVAETTRLQCLGTYRESSSVVDRIDGKSNGYISLSTSKPVSMGCDNLCKSVLAMKMKQ